MPINKNKITKEVLEKAMQCKDANDLMNLAKANGFDITKEEAEAYLAELDDQELDSEQLKRVAGGQKDYMECYFDCAENCDQWA